MNSIRNKLLLLIVSVSFIALLAGLSFLLITEMSSEKRSLEQGAELLGTVIGEYMTAPLLFNDNSGAEEILEGLKYTPHLLYVKIYTSDNELFAQYSKEKSKPHDKANSVLLKKSIRSGGTILGTSEWLFSTAGITEAINAYVKRIIILLIVMVALTFVLGNLLQRPFVEPLLRLVELMKQVTSTGDYSLRTEHNTNDEVGQLYAEFNNMLSIIEARNREIHRAHQFLMDTINSIPSIIISVDKKGVVIDVNSAASNNLKKSEDELIGCEIVQLYPGLEDILEKIPDIAVSQSQFQIKEREHLSDSGVMNYYTISISPLLGGEGVIVQMIDISEEVEMKQQLFQNRKLEAIGQLAGGVAHDFNNQIAGIMGFAELLKMNAARAEDSDAIESIIVASKRAAALTSKLLSFSRKHKFENELFDINDMVRESVTVLERSLQKKVTVEMNLDDKGLMVQGDSSQIANALLNLGINARDAMEKGGHLTFVTTVTESPVTELPEGNYVHISVIDTGTGMSKEIQEKVFEPFFTTKGVGKGTGMGLAAVYGTIKQHNGTILLESEMGVGTTFHIYLPLSSQVAKTVDQGTVSVEMDTNLTIAVVDDEDSVRISTKLILQKAGFTVLDFRSGHDAIQFFKTNPFDVKVIVSDNMMPDINGLETIKTIKKYSPEIIAIISSGYCSQEDENEYRSEGVVSILDKPCAGDVLIQEIYKAVESRGIV